LPSQRRAVAFELTPNQPPRADDEQVRHAALPGAEVGAAAVVPDEPGSGPEQVMHLELEPSLSRHRLNVRRHGHQPRGGPKYQPAKKLVGRQLAQMMMFQSMLVTRYLSPIYISVYPACVA